MTTSSTAEGPVLEAGAFVLRPWRTEEADWYVAGRDELVYRWTTEDRDLTVARRRVEIESTLADSGRTAFAIVDAASGAPVGNLGVSMSGSIAEVSYWVTASARGRGAATAALRSAADWAATLDGVAELRLVTHPDNLASQRVAAKAGFTPAGRVSAPHACVTDDGMVDLFVRRPAG